MKLLEKYLKERTKDYLVTSYGTIINVKNGYRIATNDQLDEIQKKFGKLAKECGIKISRIDITPNKT